MWHAVWHGAVGREWWPRDMQAAWKSHLAGQASDRGGGPAAPFLCTSGTIKPSSRPSLPEPAVLPAGLIRKGGSWFVSAIDALTCQMMASLSVALVPSCADCRLYVHLSMRSTAPAAVKSVHGNDDAVAVGHGVSATCCQAMARRLLPGVRFTAICPAHAINLHRVAASDMMLS